MKIRLSTGGMNIAVDVGDKANYLFTRIANQLICNAIGDTEAERVVEKLKENTQKKEMPAMRSLPEEPKSGTEEKVTEEYHGLTYRGFVYWKCKKCGSVRGFCLKKESKGIHCMNCGDDSLFDEPLKPLYANCECGQHSRYMTNMDEEMFDMDCIDCGAPIPIKWNDHDKCYQTIKN